MMRWQPTADKATLERRAQLLADVRLFFAKRGVLEVDTPVLSPSAPTSPYLESFQTEFTPLAGGEVQTLYLQTSPEFAMKRLLAADIGPIYQIAKVFRNGELGRCHSPEFTMLEWYRPDFSLDELMEEVTALLNDVVDISGAIKLSYAAVFSQYLDVDIFSCTVETLRDVALKQITSIDSQLSLDWNGWCELLMSEVIEPQLAQRQVPVFIYDFPASQAELAKVKQDDDGHAVAARFELYFAGVELANGYDELLEADELTKRFERDNHYREQINKPSMPVDSRLLAAMQAGLPPCSGVALGLDRLIMAALDKKDIALVHSFGRDLSYICHK